MRFFLEISYRGKRFHGWQRQPNASSVQQTIEDSLSVILRHKTEITGAGRTDTGVNARKMYAHFDASLPENTDKFIVALNRLCGPDICISGIFPVKSDAHARFDAELRTYKYFISKGKTPFLNDLSCHTGYDLDIDIMNLGADILMKERDFTSFAKLHSDARTNICNISRAVWKEYEDPYGNPGIVFTISADRFLRNMVRAIVGTLVDLGRKKISLDDFHQIIASRDRCAAGTSMPPEALFLWDVKYPVSIYV